METIKRELVYGVRTNVGFIPGNPGKVNQDSYIACKEFGGRSDTHFFAVCDGHGYYGREASTLVKL
jgi:serine/threonine protein phosphatase PrpC